MSIDNSDLPLINFSNKLNGIIDTLVTEEKNIIQQAKNSTSNEDFLNKVNSLKDFIQKENKEVLLNNIEHTINLIKKFISVFRNHTPNDLTYILLDKMAFIYKYTNQIITLLNTAKTITKDRNLEELLYQKLQSFNETIQKFFTAINNKHNEFFLNSSGNKPDLKKVLDLNYYLPIETKKLVSELQLWYNFNTIKQHKYTLPKKFESSDSNIVAYFNPIIQKIRNLFKKSKKKAQFVTLTEIIEMKEFQDIALNTRNLLIESKKQLLNDNFKENCLFSELLYIMYREKILIESKNQSIDKSTKKQIEKTLSKLICDAYLSNLYIDLKDFSVLENNNRDKPEKSPDRLLSKSILAYEKQIEQQILENSESEQDKKITLKNSMKNINDLLDIEHNWFQNLQKYLNPYEKIISKKMRIISQIRDELERKQDEFFSYLDSIIEQNTLSDLDSNIDKKIEQLESILRDYEEKTSQIIETNIPNTDNLENLLDNFESQFTTIEKEISKIFKSYSNKNANIYDSITKWEDKFEEIKNRVKFTISSLLNSLFSKYSEVISKEQGFYTKFLESSAFEDKTTLGTFSFDMIMPEKLNETQLRERISNIDNKIKELDILKQGYKEERVKYEKFLKAYLKSKGIVSAQKCIICHKEIDVVNDHYIKCEFCGRLMHYLCGAWWLEKHNTCPVCNNEFLVPNSGLFDVQEEYYNPEEDGNLEDLINNKESEDEDYTSVDLDKYPPDLEKDEKN